MGNEGGFSGEEVDEGHPQQSEAQCSYDECPEAIEEAIEIVGGLGCGGSGLVLKFEVG